MRPLLLSLSLLVVAATSLFPATPQLVTDLRTKPDFGYGSGPHFFTSVGDAALFVAYPIAFVDAPQLWRTDGTAQGTFPLLTLRSAAQESPLLGALLGAVKNGNVVMFTALGAEGWKLWQTDGTVAGTVALTPVLPSVLTPVGYAGNKLFLTNAANEIWVHDASGLRQAGAFAAGAWSFTTWGDSLYVGTTSGLWKSDGTTAGTTKIAAAGAYCFQVLKDRLYFAGLTPETGMELWVTDGSEAGTHLVTDLRAGPLGTFAFGKTAIVLFGDRLFFLGANGEVGTSDGTAAGTRVLRTGVSPVLPNAAVLDGVVYFSFYDGPQHGNELWRSDGTDGGTRLVRDVASDPAAVLYSITAAATRVYYFGKDADGKTELFASDGTESGTHALPQTRGPKWAGGGGGKIVTIGDRVFFSADDGVYGQEPWVSDGSDAGTHMIANLAVEAAGSSAPHSLVAGADRLYFAAVGDDGLAHLYSSDGTAAGTKAIASAPSTGELPRPTAADANTLYLIEGAQLWKSDGDSLWLVKDFGDYNSPRIDDVVVAGGRVLLHAFDGASLQLWTTDGTGAGTTKVTDRFGSGPGPLTTIAGQTYFTTSGTYTATGFEGVLYATDGTPAGTRTVATVKDTTSFWSSPIAFGGSLLFFTKTGGESVLWRFSGTAADAKIVKRFPFSVAESPATASIGTQLLFTWQQDSTHRNQLWKTDGTTDGTALVKDFPAGNTATLTRLVSIGSRAVFSVDDGVHGVEPWVSDGTAEGTFLLRDINASGSSFPGDFFVADGIAYFSAADPEHGAELWQTDGTPAGTQLVADLAPGAASANPHELTRLGNVLYFAAATPETGRELWALPLPAQPAIAIDDGRAKESDGKVTIPVRLTAAAPRRIQVAYDTADDSAKAGRDYTAVSGNITFEPGQTAASIVVPIADDAAPGVVRSFFVRLKNGDAPIERAAAAAIVEDDDVVTDLSLSLIATAAGPVFNVSNAGPSAASNVHLCVYGGSGIAYCGDPFELAAAETRSVPIDWAVGGTIVAWVTQWERDSNPANNSNTWLKAGAVPSMYISPAMPHPGQSGTLTVARNASPQAADVTLTSSAPSVVAVPAKITIAAGAATASTTFTALAEGVATIAATTPDGSASIDIRVSADPRSLAAVGFNGFGEGTFGTPYKLIARVDGAAADGSQPTGSVTIGVDGTVVRTVPLLQQTATIALDLSAGSHVISGTYSGDTHFVAAAAAETTVLMRKATASFSATLVRATSNVVITVHGVPGHPPSGTITALENGTGLAIDGPLVSVSDSASAAMATGFSPLVSSFKIIYSGDALYDPGVAIIPVIPPTRGRAVRH